MVSRLDLSVGMQQAVICFLVRGGRKGAFSCTGESCTRPQEGDHCEREALRSEGPPVQEGDAQILLGYKKVGFGKGKYGGAGGKREPGETLARAAVRELEEETGVRVREADLLPMAYLTFLFPFRPAWSQEVVAFVALHWEGEAGESREIVPTWFDVTTIPYREMWDDCRLWLPYVLAGQPVRARFVYAADNQTVSESHIEQWAEPEADVDHFIPNR